MRIRTYISIGILLILSISAAKAQELFGAITDTASVLQKKNFKMKPNTSEVEANFLSSYYNQDGNNSPVTGGVGTESLTDFANVFIINVNSCK